MVIAFQTYSMDSTIVYCNNRERIRKNNSMRPWESLYIKKKGRDNEREEMKYYVFKWQIWSDFKRKYNAQTVVIYPRQSWPGSLKILSNIFEITDMDTCSCCLLFFVLNSNIVVSHKVHAQWVANLITGPEPAKFKSWFLFLDARI